MVTLQIIPYSDIERLSSIGKIRKLLNIAKQNKIVLLQGRLRKDEETELIKVTMEEINKEFKGIEMVVMGPTKTKLEGFAKFRYGLLNVLLGDRNGFTVIGPASIVKKIRKDPNKIELFTQDSFKRKSL